MINNNDKIDLSNALKDSNAESQNKAQSPAQYFPPGTPKMVQQVIKYSGGVIKNEAQAQYVLLGLAALAIIISLFLFFGGNNGLKIQKQTENSGGGEEAGSPADFIP